MVMARIAIIIYAGTETKADRGRLFNGLEAAAALSKQINDEVRLVFDGAGTKWIPKLEDPSHEFHSVYREVSNIAACEGCVHNHNVGDAVEDSGVTILRSKDDHASVISLIHDEYDILTF
jgi:hypothetical protein